jgi:hypothetical protein
VPSGSPFDVEGTDLPLTAEDIVSFVREGLQRPVAHPPLPFDGEARQLRGLPDLAFMLRLYDLRPKNGWQGIS